MFKTTAYPVLVLLVTYGATAAPQSNVNYDIPSGSVSYSRNQADQPLARISHPGTVTYTQRQPIVQYTQPIVQYTQTQPEVQYTQQAYHYSGQYRPVSVRVSKRPVNGIDVQPLPAGQPITPLPQEVPYQPQPVRPQPPAYQQQNVLRNPPIAILTFNQDNNFDGNFNYDYSAENGISSEARGTLKNIPGSEYPAQVMQGSYTYTAPDGTPITTTWYADETGFHAEGAHLPVPPPIPEAIARSLEYIRSLPPKPEDNVKY